MATVSTAKQSALDSLDHILANRGATRSQKMAAIREVTDRGKQIVAFMEMLMRDHERDAQNATHTISGAA